ncbi:MAG: amidohydrolase [Ruminococcaceae bacterium]|nr:amidohydrolase [Oscillospiraceae bacterium]
MQKIIDFHCHIYPEKIAHKARQSTGSFYGVECGDCQGHARDLLQRCDEVGIGTCVIHSVATKPEQVRKINAFLAQTVQEYPGRFVAFGTIHQDSEDIETIADEICAMGLRGIKLHPDIQKVALNDPRCMRMFEACRGRLMVLFHAGDDRYSYSNPDEILPVLQAFPDVTFIGAHLCGYRVWDEAVPKLAGRFDNLYVDCSSTSFTMDKATFCRYIEAFGTDRVLFGSDYPMWDPRTEYQIFRSLGFSPEVEADILYNNAARLLGL